jgi:hypothetical protein
MAQVAVRVAPADRTRETQSLGEERCKAARHEPEPPASFETRASQASDRRVKPRSSRTPFRSLDQLSNSRVSSVSRADFPPEFSVRLLDVRFQKRKRSAVRRVCLHVRALAKERAPVLRRPVSPDGAPLRCLKTLGPHSSENRHPGRQCASRGELR